MGEGWGDGGRMVRERRRGGVGMGMDVGAYMKCGVGLLHVNRHSFYDLKA